MTDNYQISYREPFENVLKIDEDICRNTISLICATSQESFPERASVFDFKDATTRDLVIAMYFLVYFSYNKENVPPGNHQQKCLKTEFVVFFT